MWTPRKIILKNLFAHTETEYEFQNGNCVMVYGENNTDPGMNSNGAGKSTILEAITLCITGNVNRDVGRDDFIGDNSDETYVEFELDNNICEVKNLVIKRWIHRKKSSSIELWENGKLNTQMTSVNEANKRIFELIGLTKDDILNFFIIGQDSNYSFLTASDTEMKSIISRLSNTSVIEDRIVFLKSKIKDTNSDLETIKKSNLKLENSIEFISEQIKDEKTNYLKRIQEKIKIQEKRIERYDNDLIELENKISDNNSEISKYKKLVSKKKKALIDVDSVYEKLNRYKKQISSLKKDINEAENLIDSLNSIKDGGVECPKCEHLFNPSVEIEVSEIPDMVKVSEIEIEDLKEIIAKKKISLERQEAKIDKAEELENDYNSHNRKLKKLKLKFNDLEDEKESILKTKNSTEVIIAELKESPNNDKKIKELKSDLSDKKDELKIKLEKQIEVEEMLEDLEFWVHHFGRKGFLTYLTNKSIKSIEGITNSYLKKINTDLQINIEGFSVLKSGDIREKIDVTIVRNGKTIGSYNRYSGGERGRINIANIVGIQKLFNLTAPNGGFDFLGLDEVFEGLDVTGQKDVIKILETLGVTTMVVSHRNEPIGANNEIIIEKTNGISFIQK